MGRHRKRTGNVAGFFRKHRPEETVPLFEIPSADEQQQQPVGPEAVELVVRTPSPVEQFASEPRALSPEHNSSMKPLLGKPVPRKTMQQATKERVQLYDLLRAEYDKRVDTENAEHTARKEFGKL